MPGRFESSPYPERMAIAAVGCPPLTSCTVTHHTHQDSLRDELKRGYVNDLKELRANSGKAFRATEKLAGDLAAAPFPSTLALVDPRGAPLPLPPPDGALRAGLVCVAFRSGAEEMLASWREPFRAQFAGETAARVYELSLVDSALMGVSSSPTAPLQGRTPVATGTRLHSAQRAAAPCPSSLATRARFSRCGQRNHAQMERSGAVVPSYAC